MDSPLQTGGKSFLFHNVSVSLSSSHRGFSELAWGSRGVSIGHDLPTEDWENAVENALTSFHQTPYVLQKFHRAERLTMSYYDFEQE